MAKLPKSSSACRNRAKQLRASAAKMDKRATAVAKREKAAKSKSKCKTVCGGRKKSKISGS